MLEDNNHIDKLLQKGMENFEPMAPEGVWENIAKQLPSPIATGVSVNSVFQAIQKASWGIKLGVVLGLGFVSAIVYVASTKKDAPQIAQKESVQEIPGTKEIEQKLTIENASEKQAQKNTSSNQNTPIQKLREPQVQTITNAHAAPVIVSPNNETQSSNLVQPKENKAPEKLPIPIRIIQHNKVEKTDENSTSTVAPEFGNAFSPDGDGKNDTWEIRLENPVYFHLKIMDASGRLVFETEQYGQFWNGLNQKNGFECEAGTYAFVIDYQANNSEKIKTKNGFLSLYR